jgi:Heterokaryon incompatibility protein (HET)
MVIENLRTWLGHTQNGLTDYNASMAFWADVICINRDDDEEKAWRVQQMRDIYKNADSVFVWLGPEADDSNLAIAHLDAVGEELAAPEFTFEDFIWDWPREFLKFLRPKM